MGAFVQVFSNQEMTIRACGRACADMQPSTLPTVPVSAPLSLSTFMREHPEMVFRPEWLEAMDTSPTIH